MRLRLLQHVAQTREVARVDDGGVIRIAFEVRKQLGDRRAICVRERALLATRQQQVVGRDAGLPAVEQLAVRDLERRVVHVAIGIDDARRLAAQLQRGRREVRGRRLRDLAAHLRGAGEHQMIERQRCHEGRNRRIALHHAHLVGRKELRNQRRELRRSVRREFARLDDHAIASSERVDGRPQRQLHRVVPWRDDAHHTERLRLHVGARRHQIQRRARAARLHPLGELLEHMRELCAQHEEIGHFGETLRTHAKVRLHRSRQHGRVFFDEFLQPEQTLAAHQQGHLHLRPAGLALQRKQLANVFGMRVAGHRLTIISTHCGASSKYPEVAWRICIKVRHHPAYKAKRR